MRKTKIVCTIGPSSETPEVLHHLIANGMNTARLNFSHGSHQSHRRAIATIREAAKQQGVAMAILQDLQGPRIRVGQVAESGLVVATGNTVRLYSAHTSQDLRAGIHFGGHSVAQSSLVHIPVTYAALTHDVRSGARILIDDGRIELSVQRVEERFVECTVVRGGRVRSYKGMNLPDTSIEEPTLTEKDREDLRFGITHGVDGVALSFVRCAKDIVETRQFMAKCGTTLPIIAKIERPEAVRNLEELLQEADGVMVARGDLGVEMGPEEVPILQKRIIRRANATYRLVITATQMLESMTSNLRPTRAEASDVANAVFDGTDAVMLSGETSIGAHPAEAVRVMDRIIRAAEEEVDHAGQANWRTKREPSSFREAISSATREAAAAIDAAAIVVYSESGRTAKVLSKQRLSSPIYAFTPHESIRQRMALYAGVIPFTVPAIRDADARIVAMEARLKERRDVESGDRLVILSGMLADEIGGSHALKLHEVS